MNIDEIEQIAEIDAMKYYYDYYDPIMCDLERNLGGDLSLRDIHSRVRDSLVDEVMDEVIGDEFDDF